MKGGKSEGHDLLGDVASLNVIASSLEERRAISDPNQATASLIALIGRARTVLLAGFAG